MRFGKGTTFSLVLPFVVALAGCSSSSTDRDRDRELVPPCPTCNTPPPEDALTGTGTYTGGFTATVSDINVGIEGVITVTADFDASMVSGTLDEIVGHDPAEGIASLDGTLTFSTDTIADSGFTADNLSGTLTNPFDEPFVVAGTIGGTFMGANAEQVEGTFEGTVFDVNEDDTYLLTDGEFRAEDPDRALSE